MVIHFHNLKSKDHFYIWRSKALNASLVEVCKTNPLLSSGLALRARQTGVFPRKLRRGSGQPHLGSSCTCSQLFRAGTCFSLHGRAVYKIRRDGCDELVWPFLFPRITGMQAMRIFCDEIILFPLRKKKKKTRKMLKAPSDLTNPTLSPAEWFGEASAACPLASPRETTPQVSDPSSAVRERVGESSPRRLRVSAAPPAASAGEEKGARCSYGESTSTPTTTL